MCVCVCPATRETSKTPMVHDLAANNNNKMYTETMILWNNHYNLIFNVGLSDNSIRNEDEKHEKIFSTTAILQ